MSGSIAVPRLHALAHEARLNIDTYRKGHLKKTTQVVAIIQRSLRLEASAFYECECLISKWEPVLEHRVVRIG